MNEKIIVIAGPTASGKSELALKLAAKFKGVIINADSMQVYKDIPIVSAQPTKQEQLTQPHSLYGMLDANILCSAGYYIKLAEQEIERVLLNNQLPILVGGTGLYLKSLIYGMADIPDISNEIRNSSRDLFDKVGAQEFHQMLAQIDPVMSEKLNIPDKQRVIRAFEVIKQTGKSISDWQNNIRPGKFQPNSYLQIGLMPERKTLYEKCNKRFVKMLEMGAIEEVKALNEITIDNSLPIRRAQGVPEITAYLKGEITLDQATEKSQQITRNYAKRQFTWFKHQMKDMHKLEYVSLNEIYDKCVQLINSHLTA